MDFSICGTVGLCGVDGSKTFKSICFFCFEFLDLHSVEFVGCLESLEILDLHGVEFFGMSEIIGLFLNLWSFWLYGVNRFEISGARGTFGLHVVDFLEFLNSWCTFNFFGIFFEFCIIWEGLELLESLEFWNVAL